MNDEELLEHYRKRFNLAKKIFNSIYIGSPKYFTFLDNIVYYYHLYQTHRLMTGVGYPETKPVIGIKTNATYQDLLNQIKTNKKK